MATTNITPAIDPETSDLLQEGNSGPVDAIRQIRQDGVATRATARGTWMKLAQLVGFGAILTASPVAAKSPAGFAHDAGLQSAVMRSDSAVQPSVIFVAGGGTAPAAQVANLPSAAPTAQEKTPAASIVVGVEVPPEFESSKAALDTAAKDIQAMIERTGGVVVKQVVIKTVDRQPVRRPDGTPDWDRIVGGLNNPIAKTYPIAGLTAKSSAAKAGAYAQIDELLTWVANENRPENFKWRTVYVNKQEPNKSFTEEQEMAYRYEMREFREAFRAQLAANPLRDQIAIRMLMALDTLQKEVGNMPMGAIYRLAFTGRLDLWAELAILEEQLRTATTNEDKARILTRRAAILSTSGLAIADLRATFARMMVTDSLPVAKAIIPDVYLLLPSDQQGGEPRLTSISHFYPNYTPPATKGMIPGATYGHTSLDGDTLLRERFPYLDAATDGIRKSFNMSVAMTARDMPAQVAAVNAWGIGEYNKIADAVHMWDRLGEKLRFLAGKPRILNQDTQAAYDDMRSISIQLRSAMRSIKLGTARTVPIMATWEDLPWFEALIFDKNSQGLLKAADRFSSEFTSASKT